MNIHTRNYHHYLIGAVAIALFTDDTTSTCQLIDKMQLENAGRLLLHEDETPRDITKETEVYLKISADDYYDLAYDPQRYIMCGKSGCNAIESFSADQSLSDCQCFTLVRRIKDGAEGLYKCPDCNDVSESFIEEQDEALAEYQHERSQITQQSSINLILNAGYKLLKKHTNGSRTLAIRTGRTSIRTHIVDPQGLINGRLPSLHRLT